ALWANPLDVPADLAAHAGQLAPAHGRTAALRIDQPSPQDPALHLIELPVEPLRNAWLYVSADIRADQVSAKPEDWNGIKLMLKVEGPAGTRWPQAPIPVGTFDWQRFSARVLIPADATAVTLFLGLEKVSGTAWFDDLRITLARRIAQPPPAPAD